MGFGGGGRILYSVQVLITLVTPLLERERNLWEQLVLKCYVCYTLSVNSSEPGQVRGYPNYRIIMDLGIFFQLGHNMCDTTSEATNVELSYIQDYSSRS